MRSKFIVLLSLVSSLLISQSREVSSVLTKGVSDGLADRTVINAIGDSSGTYFIQTHSAIQKHFNNRVIQTLNLPRYNDNRPILQSRSHLYRLTNDHCITVIDKQTLSVTNEWCLAQATEAIPILTSYNTEEYSFLLQSKPNHFIIIRVGNTASGALSVAEHSFKYGEKIVAFNIDSKGRVFLVNEADQFVVIEREIDLNAAPPRPVSESHLPQIFIGPADQVYYSLSQNEGIYEWSTNTSRPVHSYGFIQNVNWDKKGNTLIGTTKNTRLHQDELIFISANGEKAMWTDLLKYNNRIINAYADNFNHSILAATYNGVYYLEFLAAGIDLLLYQPELQEEDFGFFIRSFTEGENGEILMVREGGDPIYIYKNRTLEDLAVLTGKIGYGTVSIYHEESTGILWILQYHRSGSSTLHAYDEHTGKADKIDLSIVGERLHVTEQYIWVTGRKSDNGMITRVHRDLSQAEIMFDQLTKGRHVRASHFSDSLYLFGTRKGIIAYSPIDQEIIKNIDSITASIPVSHITKYGNKYFVGTYGNGISIFDEDFEPLDQILVGNTASSNTVASIEQDRRGHFWVSTFDGIAILNSNLQIMETLFMNEGLSFSEYNRAASIKDNDGQLYFGNTNGFTLIDPEDYYNSRIEEIPQLDKIEITDFNKKYIIDHTDTNNHITGAAERVTLHYHFPKFQINHSDLSLNRKDISITPKPNKYKIINNTIEIDNPKHKNYNIEIYSRFNANAPISTTQIHLTPDYKYWINLLAAFAGAAFLTLIIGWRYILRMRQKAREEIATNKKYSEIKLQALRSQLNPHFVFNALSSIQYYIQSNEKKLAREFLNKFSRLMRSTLESSHYNAIKLSQEIEQITLYLELELLRFEDRWSYKIEVDEDIDPTQITIPSMLIQPLVENSIKHGLSAPLPRKGCLLIRIDKKGSGLKITVDDNGVGRAATMQQEINGSKSHVSLSTKITNERIAVMNQANDDIINLDYTDKYNAAGQSLGTVAQITLTKVDYG